MEALSLAAQNGDIEALYNVIKQDPKILKRINKIPFEETPLHTAASVGKTHFAIEIMSLEPSFAKKLNPDGFSPLHLALQYFQKETALKLFKFDKSLIRVQGKGRITPLHSAVETVELEVLAEFLFGCPDSIEDLTIRGETAVHVAVKMGWFDGFKVLLGWISRVGKKHVLDYKDDQGNTVLHLAALNSQPKFMELLINIVNVNEMNSDGLTALDIISNQTSTHPNVKLAKSIMRRAGALKATSLPKLGLVDFLSTQEDILERMVTRNVYLRKGMPSKLQDMLLVVAVLIATTAYQAALSPPGGLWQGDATPSTNTATPTTTATAATSIGLAAAISMSTPPPPRCTISEAITGAFNVTIQLAKRPGKIVMPPVYFSLFLIFNTFAVTASVGMIFLVLMVSRYSILLHFSLVSLLLSYMISVLSISPPCNAVPPITIATQFCIVCAFSIVRLSVYIGEKKLFAALSTRYYRFSRILKQYQVVSTKYI